jgi:excisionase family DNA binding protein
MGKYKSKYLKLSTVARDLDYTTRTIRRWIFEEKIPAIKINGSWRIPADWLYEYVETLKNEKIEAILENSEANKNDK